MRFSPSFQQRCFDSPQRASGDLWTAETIPLLKAVLMNVVTDPPAGNVALAVAAMSMLNREPLRSA